MKRLLTVVIIITLLFSVAHAKKDKGKPKGDKATEKATVVSEKSREKDSDPWIKFEINTGEKEITEKYILQNQSKGSKGGKKNKKKALPPGLAKKVSRGGDLPPGWQMKIARGEVLSGAVYKEAQSLPSDLIRILPPSPKRTELITIDGKIIRLLGATREILDVFDLDPLVN